MVNSNKISGNNSNKDISANCCRGFFYFFIFYFYFILFYFFYFEEYLVDLKYLKKLKIEDC